MPNNKLADLFSQLKSSIVGTKTQKLDASLDKAVKDIINYKSHSGRKGYIDLVKTVIAKTTSGTGFGNTGLYSHGNTGPAAFGQGTRLMRYRSYESIVYNINYAYRALSVINDNVLSPDDITKVSLDVKSKEYIQDQVETNATIKRVKDVIKAIKLEEKLPIIVTNTLMFGDFFCEIAPPKVALTSKSILSESSNYTEFQDELFKNGTKVSFTEKYMDDRKEKNLKITIDYSPLNDDFNVVGNLDVFGKEKKKVKSGDIDQEATLTNMTLVLHKPQLVIKLQSALFPICFGYLVFPEMKGMNSPGNPLEDSAINGICISILNNLQKKVPEVEEFKDNKELLDVIKFMIKQTDPQKALELRFVPTDKMVHFHRPSTKFYPYGESIFEASQFSAKVLMSLETALAVQRLSRSTEKRKVAIEIGLPRDAKKVIESMKEEFRKRKVSLDSFGTVDTIPSMITTFEDVYIPQKDGKPFVDISTFNEGSVDIRSKVDELKFIRDQLCASWGVPPAFIGIEENLSNKAALSEENILFARTVINHQKYLSHQLSSLVYKVFDIIDPEGALLLKDIIDIYLPTPKSLQYEREARYMNELIGLIEGLERIGIPKEYAKRKYLSNYDWDAIKKFEIDNKVEKSLDPSKNADDMMGGGIGGMSGGF